MISSEARISCRISAAEKNVLLGYKTISTGTISPGFNFCSEVPFVTGCHSVDSTRSSPGLKRRGLGP